MSDEDKKLADEQFIGSGFPTSFLIERAKSERRAKWIRNNVIHLWDDDCSAGDAVRLAGMLADALIERGYL